MALEPGFPSELEHLSLKEVVEILSAADRPRGTVLWYIENQLLPADIFCYLWARFGPPNGIQNLLRGDHSDNLVHWNWTLRYKEGLLDIQGMNFATHIGFLGEVDVVESDRDIFVTRLKDDFRNHGKPMSKCRRHLEDWVEFINPYRRLQRSIQLLVDDFKALKIDEIPELPSFGSQAYWNAREEVTKLWKDAAVRLNRAFGLCFGIRLMIPVMAEALINLILFVLYGSLD